jgi:outer membrane receptor protein involved in Fe transport
MPALQSLKTPAVYVFGMLASMGGAALAQPPTTAGASSIETPQAGRLQPLYAWADIVVTAQKRTQSIADVGMAITAATGDDLKVRDIRDVIGLAKLDPSFVVSNSNFGAPVYSIRGINYNDFSLAATPTVSVYSDETPYAYPALTKGATYDLQRVEILKGPQGTLYGQNATGGAINYISAKPTDQVMAGLEGTYGAYDVVNVNGFISGPITGTLDARLAFDVDEGGAWQRSDTRPDALGRKDTQKARLLLDWKPSDRLSASINLNGWLDRSQTQAGQTIGFNPAIPAYVSVEPSLNQAIQQNLISPHDARSADWLAGSHPANNEKYGQLAARVEYKVADGVLFTYLGSYETYHQSDLTEPSGSDINFSLLQAGSVHSDFQEGRFSGALFDRTLRWLVGGGYQDNITAENQLETLSGTTTGYGYASFLKALNQPVIPFMAVRNVSTDHSKSTAGFVNLEYRATESLSFSAGARYTQTDITHGGCTRGVGGASVAGLDAEEKVLISKVNAAGANDSFVAAAPDGCLTFGPQLNPSYYTGKLDQNNLSWRFGVDWRPIRSTLLYADVSKGYKAGSFPTLTANTASQLTPVTQEALVATELGAKSRLLQDLIEVDADLFYYDYQNKQLEGRVPDAIFKSLNVLVNIPRSMVDGAELAVKANPVNGLALTASATYLNSEVLGNTPGFTAFGLATNFKGASFPDTPRYAALVDVQYSWRLLDGMWAFVGAHDRYRSSAQSQLGTYLSPTTPFPSTVIKSYSLAGLRAGVLSKDKHWRVELFGENLFNTYYITHIEKIAETTARFAGMPATYGITLAYSY